MYDLILYLIDNVLMSPKLAPFTVVGCVVLIGMSVASVLSGGDGDAVEGESE